MSPLPGRSEDGNKYLCKCGHCGPYGGRILPRTTWYNHNPGGKKAERPELSRENIDFLLGLPSTKLSQWRKRDLERTSLAKQAHISTRVAGSSTSVSTYFRSPYMRPSWTIFMKIYIQSTREVAGPIDGREAIPERPSLSRPTTPLDYEPEIVPEIELDHELDPFAARLEPNLELDARLEPPAAGLDPLAARPDLLAAQNSDIPEREVSPLPPLVDEPMEEDLPSLPPPPLGQNADRLSPDNFLGDQEVRPLGEPPPPGPDYDSDTGLAPPGSGSDDDDDPSSSDSDSDEAEIPRNHDPGLDELHITLDKLKTDRRFIELARQATLETQFTAAELESLRNPQPYQTSPSDDKDLRFSIDFYISTLDHSQSQRAYAKNRKIVQRRYPESDILSYDQVKRRVSDLSGIVTWKHDMCVRSCVGFTGPFAALDACPHPECGELRYDQDELTKSGGRKKIPRKSFTTFALGPQIQARRRSPQTSQKMSYRRTKTQQERGQNRKSEGYVFDDLFCGSDYLKAVNNGSISDNDTVVMLSIDGAQLYRNKKSDCWIYIWILLDLAPDHRYKIRNILPGGIIPGPGHPRNLDSFLFPGLAHVSAIQREGLRVYDAYRREVYTTLIFLLLALADAIAMADVSGSVGHHGRIGCRLLCGLAGRNKPNGSHYYPVLLQPHGEHRSSCNHPDLDIADLPHANPFKYREELNYVLTSQTNAQYRERRLETGIRKPSIFDSLSRILLPPTCFPGDIMHQPVINLTALMFDLWCDRAECRRGDPQGDWDWAVLKGDIWTTHGRAVANAASCFPRSFDRTPRNPAEKLSSGYKAWELLLYFYGLGPGLFYGILPEAYYLHYCKLVVGVRIIYQRRISSKQLQCAHQLLLEWVLEFELLYYQRRIERLHFVRQCVHSLTHLGPETARIGPPSLSAQWTMERVIGVFGSLIKQPSNPFANLTEQARKVAEINALVSIWPDLEYEKQNPHGSINIADGYILLGPKDEKPYTLTLPEQDAVNNFYSTLPTPDPNPPRTIYRWGRLQIPTEQVARSHWKEVIRSSRTARTDRNLKVREPLKLRF